MLYKGDNFGRARLKQLERANRAVTEDHHPGREQWFHGALGTGGHYLYLMFTKQGEQCEFF